MLQKQKKLLGTLIIALFALSCLYSTGIANAKSTTINVNSEDKIQDAINAANAGDTIIVQGVHQEEVWVTKHLTIIGYDAVVQTPSRFGFVLTARATISGFQIQPLENSETHLAGIYITGSDGGGTISGNKIFSGFQDAGIFVWGDPTIGAVSGISIVKNEIVSGESCHGILISGPLETIAASNVIVSDNTIRNSFNYGHGIDIAQSENVQITRNKIATLSYGIHLSVKDSVISSNEITMLENDQGDSFGLVINYAINNVASNNIIRGAKQIGIWVTYSKGIVLQNNEMSSASPISELGVKLTQDAYSTVAGNRISGTYGIAVMLDKGSNNNAVSRNSIALSGNNVAGIDMTTDTFGNTAKNNNISGANIPIRDQSGLNFIRI